MIHIHSDTERERNTATDQKVFSATLSSVLVCQSWSVMQSARLCSESLVSTDHNSNNQHDTCIGPVQLTTYKQYTPSTHTHTHTHTTGGIAM